MSFRSMTSEIHGAVPRIPWDYAKTLVNRAWADVRRANLWSFQLFESNWTSPMVINAGKAVVVQGSADVNFTTAASTAINAVFLQPPSAIIQRQFRVGAGTIYNIWAISPTGGTGGEVLLTLDRAYQEASDAAATYSIFQAYYPAPYDDFLTFLSIRDMVTGMWLDHSKSRAWLDERDSRRMISWLPTNVVPYGNDQNPASPLPGRFLFEIHGTPLYPITWQLHGIRKGAALSADTDTLPFAIGEDVITARARVLAYEWAEANKGDQPKGQTSDYRFLMGQAQGDFKRLLRDYRRQDMETANQWRTRVRRGGVWPFAYPYYNSLAGRSGPGAPW
jgi:hypothetical protein